MIYGRSGVPKDYVRPPIEELVRRNKATLGFENPTQSMAQGMLWKEME